MEGSFGISSDVLLAIFSFKLRLFLWRFMSSPKGKKFKILLEKSGDDQIAKTASQCNKKHLLVSNKGFLSGVRSFSLYGKLLKMCPKMAAKSPLRGAKPRWWPQR